MMSHITTTTTTHSTADARSWWAEESVRVGTNWIGISETVSGIMYRLASASSSWRYSSC